jgi:hypothetical protein
VWGRRWSTGKVANRSQGFWGWRKGHLIGHLETSVPLDKEVSAH